MLKRLSLLMIGAVFFVTSANAMFWVDPYAGFGFGTLTVDSSTIKSEEVSTEYGIGVRAGLDFMMFFAGANVSYMMGSSTPELDTNGDAIANAGPLDFSHMTAGVIAGVSVPVLPLRFWVGYDLVNTLTLTDSPVSAEFTDITFSGSTIKAGFGFKVIPLLQIWAEYQMHTYTEVEYSLAAYEALNGGDLTNDRKNNTIMVGVSIPLSL